MPSVPFSSQTTIAVVLGLAVGLGVLLALAWRRYDSFRDTRTRRRRSLGALEAESEAEVLLERAGYVVFDRQVEGEIHLHVDGVPTSYGLRADLVVGDGERDFVAEVKTGVLAPRLSHAATRRQLLEYSIAFDVDGILLVDADAGTITEVDFGNVATL